jgi:crotonobetainyl-CoA:carnitine CoA-transferase CaiB-like acyl-CoA transferase
LAASCLLRAGATVVKVEDAHRPDGARRGDPAFYDLLNGGKRSVALDLSSPDGSAALGALVDRADVVVTSGRARAIAGLGLDPAACLAGATDKVWVAVTAHGWGSDGVGFGDDVAATAGLVAWHPVDGEPRFAGDAVADPLCGALAARAALDAWARGGRWFVDASLAGAAGSVVHPGPARPAAGDGRGGWEIDGEPVAGPRARPAERAAAPLGADTGAVLAGVSA